MTVNTVMEEYKTYTFRLKPEIHELFKIACAQSRFSMSKVLRYMHLMYSTHDGFYETINKNIKEVDQKQIESEQKRNNPFRQGDPKGDETTKRENQSDYEQPTTKTEPEPDYDPKSENITDYNQFKVREGKYEHSNSE